MSEETKNDSPRGEQKRHFFRGEVALTVRAELFALPDGSELPTDREIPIDMLNVGGGGMLLLVTRRTPTTELVCDRALVDLSIPSFGSVLVVRLLSRVVRIETPMPDELRLALEFLLLSPKEADAIVRMASL